MSRVFLQFLLLLFQLLLERPVDFRRFLADCADVLFDERILLQILADEHQCKGCQQQQARNPDGMCADAPCTDAANARAQRKELKAARKAAAKAAKGGN